MNSLNYINSSQEDQNIFLQILFFKLQATTLYLDINNILFQ